MSCQVNCNHTIHIAGAVSECSVCGNFSIEKRHTKLLFSKETKYVCRFCEYQAFKKDTIADRRDRKINEILGI